MSRPLRRSPIVAVLLVLLVFAGGLRWWYASAILVPQRFWDERFAFENVHQLIGKGWGPPANGYYPTLSYLPQALLLGGLHHAHRATGDERLAIYRVPEPWLDEPSRDAIAHRFTPLAYGLARLLQVLYATASIYVLYRLGRRLFDREVGLLAAAVLAAAPWHVHASAVFKPDALLLLTVLLALWASAGAVLESPSLKRYLLAGLAIAAAVSSKLTGGLVALPLVAATFVLGRHERRRVAFLAAAGVSSAGVFLLLNPYFRVNLFFLGVVGREYARTAADYGGTRFQVLRKTLELVYSWDGHGVIFGALALAGGGGLAWALARAAERRTTNPRVLAARAMILLYPVVHVAAYALKTPHFKANNLLPILPLTALWASWAACALGRSLRARLPATIRRPATVAAVAAAAVLVTAPPWRYVYQSLVPSTGDVALIELEKRLDNRRFYQVFFEREPPARVTWESRALGTASSNLLVFPVPRVDRLPVPTRMQADVLVFRRERLRGNPNMARRFERLSERNRWSVEPRLFRRRGPALAVVIQPLRRLEPPRSLAAVARSEGGWLSCEARLPAELRAGDLISFMVYYSEPLESPPAVRLGSSPLHAQPVNDDRRLFHTWRHPFRAGESTLRIEPRPETDAAGDCAVDLYRWGRGRHRPAVR